MTTFSIEHICLLFATVLFFVGSYFAVAKMPAKLQQVMFIIAAVLGSGGIFFRYAMNLGFEGNLRFDALFVQILQVCNFNFVLLPLMLIPKLELPRQYSVFFSMFAASTTLFSIPQSFAGKEWYDPEMLNFWFNHVFAIALPIWMMAAGRLRPQRKYIWPVTACVFAYFTVVYVVSSLLMYYQLPTYGCSFSYVHDPKGMPIITQLYELIGGPYVHLLPLIVVLIGIFYLFSLPFNVSVKFVSEGAGGKVRKKYGGKQCSLRLPFGGFIQEGYVLVGWRDLASGNEYAPGETIRLGNENLTLVALWKSLSDKPADEQASPASTPEEEEPFFGN